MCGNQSHCRGFIRKLGKVDVDNLVVTKPNRVLTLHVALTFGQKGLHYAKHADPL